MSGAVTHDVPHKCTDCGNVTRYHKFAHEQTGDVVNAFCDECDEDTDHIVNVK